MASNQQTRVSVKFEVDGDPTPGVELVRRLLAGEDSDHIELTSEVAEQAIDAFESLTFPWLFEELIESGEEFAKQVHSIVTRGLQEVAQNADDQGAENIRFGYRRRGGRSELLIAHDGDPVEIEDVLRMTLPLLSGSREDPDKIGRFGVGLKTLNQLGDRLAVHCPPLPPFEIRGGRVKRIQREQPAIRGFWEPRNHETLFILQLDQESFDWPFFRRWLQSWDSSSLLFLRSLRSVTLFDLSSRRKKPIRCALEIGPTRTIDLKMPKAPRARQVTLKEAGGRRRWTRYSIDYPRPRKLQATNKALGDTVRLQIAMPSQEGDNRIYVGLPLEEPNDLPYSLSAPFDPNAERTKLRDNNALNEWLIDRIGDFATAISLYRFAERPRSGWPSVPLPDEAAGESTWVRERFEGMAKRQRKRVAERVRLELPDGQEVRLRDLTYEPPEFEGILAADLLDRLWEETSSQWGERRAVPRSWRDRGRWRDLLFEIDGADPLYSSDCLSALDWPDTDLPKNGAEWLVEMIAAGLQAGEEEELWERRCIALAEDGGRISPREVEESGMLLVHKAGGGLAAELGIESQVARPFKARKETAMAVRRWLSEAGALREKADDEDAIRALARASLETPIDLRERDPVLLSLRNAFGRLSAEEQGETGRGLGENIGLTGHRYERGEKVAVLVRPGEAYLPSAIDKSPGWPTAAGHAPDLSWIDRRYSTVLRTPSRGGGALAFLRALGAATSPRLVAAPEPSPDPHAPKLLRSEGLSAQHREELAAFPLATGLLDDWVSPDLEAVVRDLMRERPTVRRKRARALFQSLDRTWNDAYLQKATATAVHHRYNWHHDGEVSASWVAWLASERWLSTREPRLHATAPRELTVLTEAAFEIEGENRASYAHEIEAEEVDSPVVDALAIQGRPHAGTILERLETLRRAENAGEKVEQAWADRCYKALSSYVPGAPYGDRSDLSETQLKRAFAKGGRGSGLIRAGGKWRGPSNVRRGPFLDAELGWVSADADPLWNFLGVELPSAADCVAVLGRLSTEDPGTARSGEIRAFRRLLELREEKRLTKRTLRGLPLRLHAKPKGGGRTVFAVASATVAEALGRRWPTWNPPLPLAELSPLIPLLDVKLLDETNLSAEIPAHLAAGSLDLQGDFVAAIGHFQDYLAVHHPTLHDRLDRSRWAGLRSVPVIVGPDWRVRARAGRRSALLQVRAHLFHDPLRLCVSHEDELDAHDAGGEAIANYVAGEDASPEERSTLALTWSYAYRVKDRTREEISLSSPENEAQDVPPVQSFEEFSRKGKRVRKRARKQPKSSPAPPPRELVDLDDLSLDEVEGAFLEGKRQTKLKVPPKAKLEPLKKPGADDAESRTRQRSTHPEYTTREKEDVALAIIKTWLRAERGLDLEDTRAQNSAGADAVDRERDIWIELKAHARELPETLRFPRSEAIRAEEKRGKYWLVVVWDLEKPRTPKFSIIPDPLHRLDTYIGNGLALTGLRDLAEKSTKR